MLKSEASDNRTRTLSPTMIAEAVKTEATDNRSGTSSLTTIAEAVIPRFKAEENNPPKVQVIDLEDEVVTKDEPDDVIEIKTIRVCRGYPSTIKREEWGFNDILHNRLVEIRQNSTFMI